MGENETKSVKVTLMSRVHTQWRLHSDVLCKMSLQLYQQYTEHGSDSLSVLLLW